MEEVAVEGLEGDSIGKFQLEFWLEKSLDFGLRFPTLRKSSKIRSSDVYQNQICNLKLCFKPKFKRKCFY